MKIVSGADAQGSDIEEVETLLKVSPTVIACSPSWIIIDSWILQRSKTFRFISPDKTDFEGCNRWRVAIKFKATSASSFKTSFHTKFPMNEKFCLLSSGAHKASCLYREAHIKPFKTFPKVDRTKKTFSFLNFTNKKLSENFAFGNYKKLQPANGLSLKAHSCRNVEHAVRASVVSTLKTIFVRNCCHRRSQQQSISCRRNKVTIKWE